MLVDLDDLNDKDYERESAYYLADSDRCNLLPRPFDPRHCLFSEACVAVQAAFISGAKYGRERSLEVSDTMVEAALIALMRFGDEEVPRHFQIVGDNPNRAMKCALQAALSESRKPKEVE